jgi:hypothetical protein
MVHKKQLQLFAFATYLDKNGVTCRLLYLLPQKDPCLIYWLEEWVGSRGVLNILIKRKKCNPSVDERVLLFGSASTSHSKLEYDKSYISVEYISISQKGLWKTTKILVEDSQFFERIRMQYQSQTWHQYQN